VCGPEPVLAREVIRAHREAVAGPRETLFAGDMPEGELWDRVLAGPPPGGRLAVVHGAEALREPGNIGVLARDGAMDTAFTVFVFAASDFARANGEGKQPPAEYVTAVQKSKNGQLVRCCAPSALADQVTLVRSWWPGSTENHAYDVLCRCGGQLGEAWKACDKAVRARLDPTSAMAVVVCEDGSRGSAAGFADHLVAGDKKQAMAAASRVPADGVGPALGLLSARLSALASIGASRRAGESRGVPDGVDRFLYKALAAHASSFDPARVTRDREVLAQAESAWRGGASTGVLELVCALW